MFFHIQTIVCFVVSYGSNVKANTKPFVLVDSYAFHFKTNAFCYDSYWLNVKPHIKPLFVFVESYVSRIQTIAFSLIPMGWMREPI